MDTQEFIITAHETLEGVERAIEQLALDGVETYPIEAGLRLIFDDGAEISLVSDTQDQQIELRGTQEPVAFYYDSTEEQWYARDSERPLPEVLGTTLGHRLARPVRLADLI